VQVAPGRPERAVSHCGLDRHDVHTCLGQRSGLSQGPLKPKVPASSPGRPTGNLLLIGVETIHTVPAKHFLQEDQAPAIAERIAALAMSRPSSG
jgi:hypothetical protein